MKIVVRSYDRFDSIVNKTIGVLGKQKDIDFRNVYVVVVEDQIDRYRAALKDYPVKYILSEVGGHNAIKAACEYFPSGSPLVFMDDDLQKLKIWKDIDDHKTNTDVENLGEYLNYIFDRLHTTAFWVDYTQNHMFKKGKPFLEFKARKCSGAFWGGWNNREIFITPFGHQDDNIRTAKLLEKDGGVWSFNWMNCSTFCGRNAGGMQSSGDRGNGLDRLEKSKEYAALALEQPFVTKFFESELNFEESNNMWALKLKKIKDLKKVIPHYQEIVYSQFMQNEPNKIESLESFF